MYLSEGRVIAKTASPGRRRTVSLPALISSAVGAQRKTPPNAASGRIAAALFLVGFPRKNFAIGHCPITQAELAWCIILSDNIASMTSNAIAARRRRFCGGVSAPACESPSLQLAFGCIQPSIPTHIFAGRVLQRHDFLTPTSEHGSGYRWLMPVERGGRVGVLSPGSGRHSIRCG